MKYFYINILMLIVSFLFFLCYIVTDVEEIKEFFFLLPVILFMILYNEKNKIIIISGLSNFMFFKVSDFLYGRTIIRRFLNSYHRGYERNKQKITKNLSEDMKDSVENELLLQKKISGNHPTIKTVVEDINNNKYFIGIFITSSKQESNIFIANLSEKKKSFIYVNKKEIYSFPLNNKKDIEIAKIILKLNPAFTKVENIKEKMKSQDEVNKYIEKKMTEQLGFECKVINGELGSPIDNIIYLEKIAQSLD